MNSPKSYPNIFKDIFFTFSEPLNKLWKDFISYLITSIEVLLARDISEKNKNHQVVESKLSEIKYAFFAFELLVIFIVISKIMGFDSGLDEAADKFQEVIILILFVISLFAFIGIGRI